jgi:hypothetical protein
MIQIRKQESGQAAVVLALAFVGLLAFSALAIDGGNAYLTRRNAQNAADAASMAGSRELHEILHVLEPADMPADPDALLRQVIVAAAQRNGVPDTNSDSADSTNANIEAWYVDQNGGLYTDDQVGDLDSIPSGAYGIAATAHIPFDTFIAQIIGRDEMKATTSAGSIFTESTGSIRGAIYANATDCDPNTLTLGGSQQRISGGLHSNGDLSISGNTDHPSVYTGTVEYVSNSAVQGAVLVDEDGDPVQPTQVDPAVLPLLFDIEDFAPGGIRAERAGGNYYYFSGGSYSKVRSQDLVARGLLGANNLLKPGLYFADNQFDLSGTMTGWGVTFVTRDSFSLSCSSCVLSKWEDQLLVFAFKGVPGTCNDNAIKISASETTWFGLLYAPYGGVDLSMSDNLGVYGSIVGYTVDLSGSEIEIHYDPQVDPPIAPTVVLIW